MNIQNVFVIIGEGWTREAIIKEIEEEGYLHNFFFGAGDDMDVLAKNMSFAHEVWCFGNCDGLMTYEHARDQGYDIWKMG